MKQLMTPESHTETIGLGAGDEPPENLLNRGMIQENAVMDWILKLEN